MMIQIATVTIEQELHGLEALEYMYSKEFQRVRKKLLITQTLMALGTIALNVLIPTGAALLMVPLAVWELVQALRGEVVMVAGPGDYKKLVEIEKAIMNYGFE